MSPSSKLPAARSVTAITGQVIAPDKLQAAKAAAEAERKRIHDEGHAKGLRTARHYRDMAIAAMGIAAGFVIGAVFAASLTDRGAYTAAAITDRVLGRTVPDPSEVLPPPPATRAPDEEYRVNAAEARGGCSDEQLRAGLRRCGVEPGTPRRQ